MSTAWIRIFAKTSFAWLELHPSVPFIVDGVDTLEHSFDHHIVWC